MHTVEFESEASIMGVAWGALGAGSGAPPGRELKKCWLNLNG